MEDYPYLSSTSKMILHRIVVQSLEKKDTNLQTLYDLFDQIEAGKIVKEIDDFVKWLQFGG